jgi:hypothetical protein
MIKITVDINKIKKNHTRSKPFWRLLKLKKLLGKGKKYSKQK